MTRASTTWRTSEASDLALRLPIAQADNRRHEQLARRPGRTGSQVLPHVAAVVSHGGLSTITATLAHGVPLVCIPQGRDQPMNAQRLEAGGAGRSVAADAKPAEIAAAVRSVLSDDDIRAAAARFADPDPGCRATRLVEELLSTSAD